MSATQPLRPTQHPAAWDAALALRPLRGTQHSRGKGAGRRRVPSPISPNLFAPRNRIDWTLFSSTVTDDLREEGARRRHLVGAGGTCPCGAVVRSWSWFDRTEGVPEPKPRVIHHDEACPAWLWSDDDYAAPGAVEIVPAPEAQTTPPCTFSHTESTGGTHA